MTLPCPHSKNPTIKICLTPSANHILCLILPADTSSSHPCILAFLFLTGKFMFDPTAHLQRNPLKHLLLGNYGEMSQSSHQSDKLVLWGPWKVIFPLPWTSASQNLLSTVRTSLSFISLCLSYFQSLLLILFEVKGRWSCHGSGSGGSWKSITLDWLSRDPFQDRLLQDGVWDWL